MNFDVTLDWVITVPRNCPSAPVEDLTAVIAALRRQANLHGNAPPVYDAETGAPADSTEILINCDAASRKTSYAWRAGAERVEIYGHSPRSVINAIFDFVSALGVTLTEPLRFPQPVEGGLFLMGKKASHVHHTAQKTSLCISRKISYAKTREHVLQAARNGVDEVILPLCPSWNENEYKALVELASRYCLSIARGGRELSLLVPRRLFWFHPDYFRMSAGKRRRDFNFCASNHKTREVIQNNAAVWFSKYQGTKRYYLLPDGVFEQAWWCACPACRAFSFDEQNIMAVNSAADALASIDSEAMIYCVSSGAEEEEIARERRNIHIMNSLETIQFVDKTG